MLQNPFNHIRRSTRFLLAVTLLSIVLKWWFNETNLTLVIQNTFSPAVYDVLKNTFFIVYGAAAIIFAGAIIVALLSPAKKVDKEWWETKGQKQRTNPWYEKLNAAWTDIFAVSIFAFLYGSFILFFIHAHLAALAIFFSYLIYPDINKISFRKRAKGI